MNTSVQSIISFFVLALCVWLSPEPVRAEIHYEIRSPLGIGTTDPKDLNSTLPDGLRFSKLLTFGADTVAVFNNWGLGLRFDSLSSIQFDDQNYSEVAARIFSLLVQHRWHMAPAYWAPTATVGIYSPSVVNLRLDGTTTPQFTAGRVSSASFGIEAGWISGIFILGGELGYQYLVLSDFEASSGVYTLSEANLSGPYLKFLMGLHF